MGAYKAWTNNEWNSNKMVQLFQKQKKKSNHVARDWTEV